MSWLLLQKETTASVRIDITLRRAFEPIFSVKCKKHYASGCGSVALVIQHALCMSRIMLSSVTFLALPYFSTLSHKRNHFRENVLEHKMCVLNFSTNFVGNISHTKKNSARYHHKCTYVFTQSTHYSCQILMKLEFSPQIFEKPSNIEFHEKPVQWEPSCSMRMDRRTTLIVAFRNFADMPMVYFRKDYKINSTVNVSTDEYWLQGCDTVRSGRIISTL
jgi:hypothetical protein